MTNSKRGAIPFTALGATHQLHLNTNALVRYQDLYGETLVQGVQKLNDTPGDVRSVLRIFYVGVDHDETLSQKDVGEMIDDLGIGKASELIGKAVQAAFPAAEADDAAAASEEAAPAGNARKAAAKAAKTS